MTPKTKLHKRLTGTSLYIYLTSLCMYRIQRFEKTPISFNLSHKKCWFLTQCPSEIGPTIPVPLETKVHLPPVSTNRELLNKLYICLPLALHWQQRETLAIKYKCVASLLIPGPNQLMEVTNLPKTMLKM